MDLGRQGSAVLNLRRPLMLVEAGATENPETPVTVGTPTR